MVVGKWIESQVERVPGCRAAHHAVLHEDYRALANDPVHECARVFSEHCSPVHGENILVGGDNFVSLSLIPSFSDHRLLETCLTEMKGKTSPLRSHRRVQIRCKKRGKDRGEKEEKS